MEALSFLGLSEFDIPYHQHKTFFGALRSHFRFLHHLGTGKYDRDLEARMQAEKQSVPTELAKVA